MSDTSQGPGWWLASDGKWYPPETAPLPPPLPPPHTSPLPPQTYVPPPYQQTYAPPPYHQPWGGPHPPPKRGHGCLWAVLAAVGVVLTGVVLIIVVAVVAGHKIHKNLDTTANLAGPPPPARYTVGQTGASSGFNFTVYAVKAPFTSAGQYALPTAGYEYVQVDVEVTNTRSTTQQFSSLLAFHLYDAQDHQYGEAIVAGIQPSPPDGPIAPGQAVRGLVMFEVPTATTGLRLRCQGKLTAAGAVFTLT